MIPANANIEIEYGRKDPVKFSYPINWTYSRAVLERAFPTIFMFFILAFLKFLAMFFWLLVIPYFIYCTIGVELGFFARYDVLATNLRIVSFVYENVVTLLNIIMGFVLFALVLPFFMALNKKLLAYIMPKFGYYSIVLMGRTMQKTFIFTDVENKKCIVPNFKNVFLNYNTTGDFSKYLKKVKIIAYEFKYNIRQRIAVFIKHKKEKNDFIYYAVFEFSKAPYDGFLECEYY